MIPATHREQLVSMLCEAAEIEHCLMCSYLYAAFSLKQDASEGLTASEMQVVARWRAELVRIATDEMTHLALVNNLLISLGARPHYRRYNFPISGGLFPADITVTLAPFDEATLDHFVYVERPMGTDDRDGDVIEKVVYPRSSIAGRLMAFSDDYETVGELYEAIEQSFELMIESLGPDAVFLGPVQAQLTTAQFRLVGLLSIASMDDVRRAVHLIRHQGEGAAGDAAGSHYARFCAIRSEWATLRQARPDFRPARPAARNPVMRSPVNAERIQVLLEPASQLLDAANAVYGLMVRLLALMSDEAMCPPASKRRIGDQAIALMHLVGELGSKLTTLPANDAYPGVNAGITFTVSRGALAFQSTDSAASILTERFEAIAARLQALAVHAPMLARYAHALEAFASDWRKADASATDGLSPATTPAPPVDTPAAHGNPLVVGKPDNVGEAGGGDQYDPSQSSVDVARGQLVEIRFDHARCVHSRNCVLHGPRVFVANKPGEWIYPDTETPDRIAALAESCPSGAITYTRLDGKPDEKAPEVNTANVRENGPLAIHADLQIVGVGNCFRATLCRCGQSKRKPFCDGSHNAAHFTATGEPATIPSEPLPVRSGPLTVTPLRDGPLDVTGSLEICTGTGRTIDRITSTRLCRCGQSANKPFCDGSHAVVGFKAAGE